MIGENQIMNVRQNVFHKKFVPKDDIYSDEYYTPMKNAEEMFSLLNLDEDEKLTILCPFDSDKSTFVQYVKERKNWDVIYGIRNFCNPDVVYNCDVIITNPPFSFKNEVIERSLFYVCEKDIDVFLLLPMDSISGVGRSKLYKQYGIIPNVYIPDARIKYTTDNEFKKPSPNFHSVYLRLKKGNTGKVFYQWNGYK